MPQERTLGNSFTVNLSVWTDFRKCVETDSVADTVNYARLNEIVLKEMEVPSNLLETVAYRIVNRIRGDFEEIEKIEVEILKQAPPIEGQIESSCVRIVEENLHS